MAVYFNGRLAIHTGCDARFLGQEYCFDIKGDIVTVLNTAKAKHTLNSSSRVFINGHPLLHQKSLLSHSKTSAPGIVGMHSGTVDGIAEFITGSPTVTTDGYPVVRDQDLMVSNNRNTSPAPMRLSGVAQKKSAENSNTNQSSKNPHYQITVDVFCDGDKKIPGFIAAANNGKVCAECNLSVSTNSEKNFRRYSLMLSQNTGYDLCLLIPGETGHAFHIPLAKQVKVTTKQSAPALSQAQHQLVPVRFRWRIGLNDKPLLPAVGDYSDIVRLPDFLRSIVHRQVSDYCSQSGETCTWPEMLRPAMQQQVIRYLQPALAPKLEEGWLYVFNDNKVLRECRVDENGEFREVNLLDYTGEDQRVAHGVAAHCLVLPFKIAGQTQQISVAFSRQQWSWSQLLKIESDVTLQKVLVEVLDFATIIEQGCADANIAVHDKVYSCH